MPKSMVLDLGWFDRDKMKFEDQQKGIRLFIKSNRVIGTDDRITEILAQLRGSIASIHAQKKLDQLEDETDIQDQNNLVKELKMTLSNKSKTADTKWKIKTFKQGKKHITNFIIEFEVLAIKAETDNLHAIFLLKKNVQIDIIETILEYPLIVAPEILKEWKVAII